ncbi:MAG: L-idonate 5-dehydrogenase [Hyphomicrobiales bacterium]|nr:L-idonate 5-dehydrogenase [Hyphomicrobiales bacterium]MDE2116037.1 L-idonate 5-dehydrogenase [Hyphomicrobiales bacterium]
MKTKALVLHKAGDLRVEEREVGEVGPDQVLLHVGAGGLCGSDIHYFWDGGIGAIRVSEPIILGHEAAGTVEAVGVNVRTVKPGDRVAIDPSRPCGTCRFCLEGMMNQCENMDFHGSAMRKPHSQGLFRNRIVVAERQCLPVGDKVSLAEAACMEPLSVALHAVNQAGSLMGRRVLVTGSGPIGALTVAAARYAGAQEIIATDIADAPLKTAIRMGATQTINSAKQPDRLATGFSAHKGWFDVAFECTGVGPVLPSLFPVVRPGGTIVQVGVMGETSIPVNALVGKEISLRGTHRANTEYALAAALIRDRRIDVTPILTATLPMEQAAKAFELVRDRNTQMKVQLSFTD